MEPSGFDPAPLLAWASWLGLAGVLVLVAVSIAIPVYRKTMLTLAAGALGLVVASYVMGHVMAWLPIISLVVAVLGVAFVAWQVYLRLRVAVKTGNIMQAQGGFADWNATKRSLLTAQGGEGSAVQRDLDKLCHDKALI